MIAKEAVHPGENVSESGDDSRKKAEFVEVKLERDVHIVYRWVSSAYQRTNDTRGIF